MGVKKKEIKAIVFDIGSVVTKRQRILIAEILSKHYKIDLDKFLTAMFKKRSKIVTGKISGMEYYKDFANRLKIKDFNEFKRRWESLMEKHINPNKRVQSLIKNLKKNYRIIAFTNVTKDAEKIRFKKRVYDYFDIKLISFIEGMKKPDKDFYKLLIKRSKLNPNELLFIDDIKKNLLTAQKFGMNTILFKNTSKLKKDLKKIGVIK